MTPRPDPADTPTDDACAPVTGGLLAADEALWPRPETTTDRVSSGFGDHPTRLPSALVPEPELAAARERVLERLAEGPSNAARASSPGRSCARQARRGRARRRSPRNGMRSASASPSANATRRARSPARSTRGASAAQTRHEETLRALAPHLEPARDGAPRPFGLDLLLERTETVRSRGRLVSRRPTLPLGDGARQHLPRRCVVRRSRSPLGVPGARGDAAARHRRAANYRPIAARQDPAIDPLDMISPTPRRPIPR